VLDCIRGSGRKPLYVECSLVNGESTLIMIIPEVGWGCSLLKDCRVFSHKANPWEATNLKMIAKYEQF
jgi:hypothetical protein